MARFAGLGLEPILADSDDDDGDMSFRRGGFGRRGGDDRRGRGDGNDAMTDTWQNEVGNIKVNDRGMRVAQRDGQEELLLEGQVVPDQLVFGDGRVIGRGACSVVNLAEHKDTGQLFAVKVFSLLDREKRRQLDREIGTLLRSLENGCCSQLVDFFGAFKRPDGSIRVVLEYMDRGSLADVMEYRTAVQIRWKERRILQEKQKLADIEASAARDASPAALLLSNGHAPHQQDAHISSDTNRDNANAGVEGTGVFPPPLHVEDDTDDEDDMPATFERLGGPHHTSDRKVTSKSGGGASISNSKSSQSKNGGGAAIPLSNGVSSSSSSNSHSITHSITNGKNWDGYYPAPAPRRTSHDGGKPAPLSEGACITPAIEKVVPNMERGRGKDSPWGGEPTEIARLGEEDDDESPEASERRRVEAAAELQRQREQEEWDRAFEEELMQTGLPEDVVAACVYQILAGLTYLHEHNQLHRDVKPSNILLNARGEVKLTDFGIARELDHAGAMVETVVGTVRYMSPERLHGEAYGRPADVWGLGLVMIECVTQEAPYADGCSQIEILQTLKEHGGSGLLPSHTENRVPLSEGFVTFVTNCLKLKPEDRLSTAELLNSRWFIEQGVHGREEAVELMAEYLEGLYGPHAFKYFGDDAAPQPAGMA